MSSKLFAVSCFVRLVVCVAGGLVGVFGLGDLAAQTDKGHDSSAESASTSSLDYGLLARQQRRFRFYPSLGGMMILREESDGSFDMQDFFLNDTLIEELELDESETQMIRDIFDGEPPSGPESPKTNNADPELAIEGLIEKAKQVEAKFSRQQRERLKELHVRFLLQLHGFANFLNDEAIVHSWAIPTLTNGELEKLRAKQTDIGRRLIETEVKLLEDAWSELAEPLSKKQRELFEQEWKGAMVAPNSIGHVIRCLDVDACTENLSDDTDEGDVNLIWDQGKIRLGADGNSTYVKPAGEVVGLSELSKFYGLGHILTSTHVRNLLDIVPEQIAAIDRNNKDFDTAKWPIIARLAGELGIPSQTIATEDEFGAPTSRQIFEWPDDPELSQKIEKIQNERLSDLARSHHDLAMKILQPHQREALKTLTRQLKIRSFGPIADLKKGELRHYLELDETQFEKVISNAEEIREDLSKQTRKLRNEAFDELLADLPNDTKEILMRLIGKPPKSGFCDSGLLGHTFLMSE